MAARIKGKCQNCGKVCPEEELNEVHDFWGRVLVGDEMPLSQCPDPACRMLCDVVQEPHKIVVEWIGAGSGTSVTSPGEP